VRDIESDDQGFVAVVPWLQELHTLVKACKFAEFWGEWNGKSEAAQSESQAQA
jgi:translation initiation factor 3 subunit K